MELVAAAVQLGLSVALVLFFVSRDAKRQVREDARIAERQKKEDLRVEALEVFQREILLSINTQCITVLTQNSEALRECAMALQSNSELLKSELLKNPRVEG